MHKIEMKLQIKIIFDKNRAVWKWIFVVNKGIFPTFEIIRREGVAIAVSLFETIRWEIFSVDIPLFEHIQS